MNPLSSRALGAAAVVLALAACGGDGSSDSTSAADQTTAPADAGSSAVIVTAPPATTSPAAPSSPGTAAPGTDPATTVSLATSPPATVGDPVVASELVATLESPVGLAARAGDDGLYVVEQVGRVVRVAPDGSTVDVADVSDRIVSGGEQGLLGLAFAPDGQRAWLNYTDRNGNTVIAEYPVGGDGTFDTAAERVLLGVEQPYANHNGGDLAVGPDGMLYIALGDGGSADDPERRASDPTNLLGKLLRIDPAPSGDAPYTIPPDNPFANGSLNGVAGAPEVWSWGLRNPWRIAFDALTGDLWIADVGQNQFEEIDRVAPTERPAGWGANFGWSGFEGTQRFNDDVADPGDTVMPVLTYEHGSDGCSISGGAVYRGTAISGLEPAYVYSDFCSGRLWALDLAGGRNLTLLDGAFSNVTAVRAGPDGELYVLEADGDVLRLIPGPSTG